MLIPALMLMETSKSLSENLQRDALIIIGIKAGHFIFQMLICCTPGWLLATRADFCQGGVPPACRLPSVFLGTAWWGGRAEQKGAGVIKPLASFLPQPVHQ